MQYSRTSAISIVSAMLAFSFLFPTVTRAESVDRETISLNGIWEIAEGSNDRVPESFGAKVPVPGLVNMARPAFAGVGTGWSKDERREAFWYRRTFTISGEVPSSAILKINKARYGTKVFINGELAGEHLPNFTPAYLDVGKFLKGRGTENVVVIRVGASVSSLPDRIVNGHDIGLNGPDRDNNGYLPGIFDSVSLSLAGTPYLEQIQTAPDVEKKTLRVVAHVWNSSDRPVETTIRCIVREAKSAKLAGEAESSLISMGPRTRTIVEVTIPVEHCQLWSPESPFLYSVETSTKADKLTTRIGMREYKLDLNTKLGLLNGRPYWLRGTNILFNRFLMTTFLEPENAGLAWDDDWVRGLFRLFKSMHWNAARLHLGPAPERWYEIADEEGYLFQNEYAVWWPPDERFPGIKFSSSYGKTVESLAGEYREWIYDTCNHPSVIIWNGCNETLSDLTLAAIEAARGVDIQNRPWDDGYGKVPVTPSFRSDHIYITIQQLWPGQKKFTFREYEVAGLWQHGPQWLNNWFEHMSSLTPNRKAKSNPTSGPSVLSEITTPEPAILNEYGWAWLTKAGEPGQSSIPVYTALLGADASPARRREWFARYIATETQLWRCRRLYFGVLCNPGLCPTLGRYMSDNFVDYRQLKIDPQYVKYVSDAFAPVGMLIDWWKEEAPPGQEVKIPIVVINDTQQSWSGVVKLSVVDRTGKSVSEGTKLCQVKAPDVAALQSTKPLLERAFAESDAVTGKETVLFPVTLPEKLGEYQIISELTAPGQGTTRSYWDFSVVASIGEKESANAAEMPK